MKYIENKYIRNCNNYLFPLAGGKKLRIIANKIAKTYFLLERQYYFSKDFIMLFCKSMMLLIKIKELSQIKVK
jgi:hypothetical protein